jgi:predicted transport protein
LSADKTIQSVAKEVKVYAEEDLLAKGNKTKELYLSLKEKLQVIDPSFVFHPTKNYIGVQIPGNWRNIIYINFLSNKLSISFARSQPSNFTDPKNKLVYSVNSMKHFNQHITWYDVNNEEDILYGVELFKQAYMRFKKEFA